MLEQWVAACVAAFAVLGGARWENPQRQERAADWSQVIVEETLNQGEPTLNPLVVVCIIFAESSFQPQARGQQGEIGLFQVMPRGHAANGRSQQQLEEPEENLRVGIEGLRRGLQECDQGLGGALAWHNRGWCVPDPDEVRFVRRIRGLYTRVQDLRVSSPPSTQPDAPSASSEPAPSLSQQEEGEVVEEQSLSG